MKIAIDIHTHSIASGHAFSTVEEMAKAANQRGLEGFILTDHTPGMPGSAHIFHFYNLRALPRVIHGTKIFRGAEANISDFQGSIDLDQDVLSELEWIIASFHPPVLAPGTKAENTAAYLGAIGNPRVSVIGHPDDSRYPYDVKTVVKAAGEHSTLLEINNTSLTPRSFRVGAVENYRALLSECRRQGVSVVLGSDAHFSSHVGSLEEVLALLKEVQFPKDLVANRSMAALEPYMAIK